ncbi:NAD(P)-binding protein [Amniculicola lignicola CBS 123094]|uniref:NAD(P)-binding protein n=1 Tax=Amniculicola lignicola CBS 123094 TaxID=1392246 RepID=A0A6A5VT86_9PLEO|nr:NAD(P)-binding protein [Amniculicola lignicola CBS 123094]
MPPHNILITGGSGYLGGTLLAHLSSFPLPLHGTVYASVRTAAQAESVKQYNVTPLPIDFSDTTALKQEIINKEISIIFFLIDARHSTNQVSMIEALGEVKTKTGKEVHFLHTTGAKLFSDIVGHPTNKPLLDTDPGLYEIQKTCKGPFDIMNECVQTNNTVIEIASKHGVKSYIFAPCIVYGEGEGFGNKISIQTVAIVQAAKALRQVYKTQEGNPTWPVCHVLDNTTLYLQILKKILEGEDVGHGKDGYFLASPGSVAWNDIYSAIAKAMFKRGAVDDGSVKLADDATLEKLGDALRVPAAFVPVQLSRCCTFTAVHGKEIGWKPKYEAEHILEVADAEVELILKYLK